MVTRTRTAAKPAATRTRPAATAKKTASNPAPAPQKRTMSQAQKENLAKGRAARAAKQSKPPLEQHPAKEGVPSGHDVVRAGLTFFALLEAYAEAYRDELDALAPFIAPMGAAKQGRPEKDGPARKVKVEPEDSAIGEVYDYEETRVLPLAELRELAADLAERGIIAERKVKATILKEMEEAGLFREEGDSSSGEGDEEDDDDEEGSEEAGESDEDEDEDSESEDDDDEEEEYSRADLRKMTLDQVQELAKENKRPWKGMDKEALIVSLIPDEDEEDEDGGELEIDPSELPSMGLDELLGLCEQAGWRVPNAKRKSKKAVIDLILENLGDDEEDEDE